MPPRARLPNGMYDLPGLTPAHFPPVRQDVADLWDRAYGLSGVTPPPGYPGKARPPPPVKDAYSHLLEDD